MGLPMLHRCCVCVSLERGSMILAVTALVACAADIAVGAWNLPRYCDRKPEDNLISLTMVMFAALSAVCNLVIIAGIYMRRSDFLQVSLLFNSLFVLFNFLVAAVTCLFSPEYKNALSTSTITATVVGMVVAIVFCGYYFLVINSLYRKMKMTYGDTAVPIYRM